MRNQRKKKSKTESELIDSMQIVIDSLKFILVDKDSLASNSQIAIDSLKEAITNMSVSSSQRIDFLEDSLSKEIEFRDKEILQLRSNIVSIR